MKTLIALALLVVAVRAMPQHMSRTERVEASFNKWLLTEKREVTYADDFDDAKVCTDTDCCQTYTCEHGTCMDLTNADTEREPLVKKYGYVCFSADDGICGTNLDKDKPVQYSGIFCNVPARDACDKCGDKHGNYNLCYPHSSTKSGYICLKKDLENPPDYIALDRKELDTVYGKGTAKQLERIAKEEDEAQVKDKNSLSELLRMLINELGDDEQ